MILHTHILKENFWTRSFLTISQSSPRNEMSIYQEMEVTRKWTGLVVGRVEMDRTLIRYNEFG